MLTPSDRKNIENFENLKSNHQRVFKHRLRMKCLSAIKDIRYVLSNCIKLDIKPDRFIDINELVDLLEDYDHACLLQNM